MWKCPKCDREFKSSNQWHSCYNSSVDEHLYDKPPWVLAAFELLLNELENLGEYNVSPAKTGIFYKVGGTFLSVYLRSTNIKLEFQTKELNEGDPIKLSKRVSKNRVYNIVLIKDIEDLTSKIFELITESYYLVKGENN